VRASSVPVFALAVLLTALALAVCLAVPAPPAAETQAMCAWSVREGGFPNGGAMLRLASDGSEPLGGGVMLRLASDGSGSVGGDALGLVLAESPSDSEEFRPENIPPGDAPPGDLPSPDPAREAAPEQLQVPLVVDLAPAAPDVPLREEAVRLCPAAPDVPPGAAVLSEAGSLGRDLVPAGVPATLLSPAGQV